MIILSINILPSFAENWTNISQNNFIDKDSLKREYNIIKPNNKIFSFWMKSYDLNHNTLQNVERGFNKEIEYIKYQGQIDCSDKTFLFKYMILCDKDNKEFYKHRPNFKILQIKPGTVGEDICKITEKL